MKRKYDFYEFFAGGGMARAGLGSRWNCLFANDFDAMKARTYATNWGHELVQTDVALLRARSLPGAADLAWASFPCQDLSLAGDYRGLGKPSSKEKTRSGTFWPFWHLMRTLVKEGRGPRTIVIENVYGTITSNQGRDFTAITESLAAADYRFGAMVIDARYFVPQSRPRLFIVAVRGDRPIPQSLIAEGPSAEWHHPNLVNAFSKLSRRARAQWIWWKLATPAPRTTKFSDLIEDEPTTVKWDEPRETQRLLRMMTPINRAKVRAAMASGRREIGGLYKRTRTINGKKMQRAEVRFDEIAGCLRTPAGGSSRQRILVVHRGKIRSRLISSREAARLMGLSDSYALPNKYNDAYHVAGDGVVVPVVRHLAKCLIEPLLEAKRRVLQAAE